jgi:hypothetical protein
MKCLAINSLLLAHRYPCSIPLQVLRKSAATVLTNALGAIIMEVETNALKLAYCFPNTGHFYVYDRNSMYPAVMRDELHPVSNRPELQTRIDKDTDFAYIEAENNGALTNARRQWRFRFHRQKRQVPRHNSRNQCGP